MTTNSPWRVLDEYDPELHDDEPYERTILANSLIGAGIGFVVMLAIYGGGQVVMTSRLPRQG